MQRPPDDLPPQDKQAQQAQQAQQQKRIGGIMFGLMWLGIFLIMGIMFSQILDKQNHPNQAAQTLQLQGNIKQLELQRNRQGHYIANGSINGVDVVFMLDTGATDVSIPLAIARKLQLQQGPGVMSQTANGSVEVYLTRLNEISLGEITMYNIRATINPGFQSDEILLGMSFLKHLEFSQRGNTLTLRQYPDDN